MREFLLQFTGATRLWLLLMILTLSATTVVGQTVLTDKGDYYPGDVLEISGFNWEVGETVELKIIEESPNVGEYVLYAQADSNGNIYNDEFIFDWSHFGVSFQLTATGLSSGSTDTVFFTDAPIVQSLIVNNQSPSCVVNPISVVYDVQVGRTNQGANNSQAISLSVTNLPSGLTAKFFSNSTFSSEITSVALDKNESANIKLRISGTAMVGSSPNFTVWASASQNDYLIQNAGFTVSNFGINSQPVSSSLTYGQNTSFSIGAVGAVSYQWQVNTGGGFTNITDNSIYSGTGTATLNVAKPGVEMSGYQYRAVVIGNCGAPAESNAATLEINKKEITGSFIAEDKVYDGSTSATITGRSLTGVIGSDAVSLTGGTAAFTGKNIGAGKTVTASDLYLDGVDADNYSLTSVETATADITARALVLSNFVADDKTYNGTTSATGDGFDDDRVAGDELTFSYDVAFADKNVATGKDVNFSSIVISGGADQNNYSLSTTLGTATADITARALVLSNFVADDKTYDGNTSVTGDDFDDDRVAGDELTFSYDVAFADKNVATGKDVNFSSIVISGGADQNNYSLSTTSGTATADITARALFLSNFIADDKNYDGTTSVTGDGFDDDRVANDELEFTYNVAFVDKNVATGKDVNFSNISISGGADQNNYSLAAISGNTTADITALAITGNFTANDKVYDGDAVAEVVDQTLNGAVVGDDVSLTGGSAAFADKNVGVDKVVTASDMFLDGDDAGNYSLTSIETTTADIIALAITGNFTANDKVYDGDAVAEVVDQTLNGAVVGDDVSLSRGSAAFVDKNVGVDKVVIASGMVLSGDDADNYSLTSVGTTTADITALAITGNFTANDKVYDGDAVAEVVDQTLNGAVGGDDVSLTGGSAAFADKNVGVDKVVTASGMVLSGDDAGNYSLTSVGTTTADITALAITGNFTANDKVYDGYAVAEVVDQTLNGAVVGDDVSLTGGSAAFADKNVGVGKVVTASGMVLSGDDAGNYNLTSVGTTTADITARALVLSNFVADSKTYDGTTSVTGDGFGDDRVSGDDLEFGYSVAFEDENVDTGKDVSFTSIVISGGADANNYSLSTTSGTAKADISARALVLSNFVADSKTYDGTTSVTGDGFDDNRVTGDDLEFDYSVAFEDKNVNTGKDVNYTSIVISGGADANNYSLSTINGTATADITAKDLVVLASGINKTYDGTTNATVNLSTDALTDDAVTADYTSASFADANVADGIEVSVSGITISGDDAGNYNLTNNTATTSANISSRSIIITPVAYQSKFCGQDDPTFTYTPSETLIEGNSFTGSLGREEGEGVGFYTYILGDLSAGGNYSLNLGASDKFEIKGVTIDASASSNPVAIGSTATLRATVQDLNEVPVEGVVVKFYFDNELTSSKIAWTDVNGVAILSNVSVPDVKVYKVTAVAGGGCSESVAYLPVYDPSAGFVTGGGWIWSPAGAYVADATLEGKANFGFVAKYKKGKTATNEVEGNTEFQFKAGELNFKSQLHESGSLVISGGKATYRGQGTINGTGSYKFTLVAFDGNWNNGTTSDRFRIKIWGEQGVVYDNGLGADENSNEASILGGGSIVIHEVKGGGSQKAQQEATVAQTFEPVVEILTSMSVSPNPVSTEALVRFTFNTDASAMVEVFDFSNRKVAGLFNGKVTANQVNEVTLNRDGLPGGSYFVKVSASNGQIFTKQIIID
ncbi:Por secretion system C-terminal sorting domain-containing protein [Salinimicrobium sediminis]|uniref:Por secretion system C-terminal sorting domain-containing protein n=1 Tax=Salinimicrobium sediminis TaxID=1343891 RepID=A0A285X2X7_9FLAO|nr:YDG domain-containing protein [Salinimicrobium sediminis]SOC78729.1 Por secretion system C-terminal sorting domain-containing protein [Salinimicrobium sediminis]